MDMVQTLTVSHSDSGIQCDRDLTGSSGHKKTSRGSGIFSGWVGWETQWRQSQPIYWPFKIPTRCLVIPVVTFLTPLAEHVSDLKDL